MEKDAAQKVWSGQMCKNALTTKGPGSGAKLTVTNENLQLKGLLGDFTFTTDTVDVIEKAGFFPWFGTGFRIVHKINDYPSKIMFWPLFARSKTILKHLKDLGYNVRL
ncbi:MAG: hypothetical protein FVQ80_03620 [Planctomycetes bacterium]|nr:hypothetical protein [Planctomycetota bacterium]